MLISVLWDVDPEIFTIFGREIRWYGVLWATGVMLTAYVVQRMYKAEKLPESWFDSLFMYVIIGLIIGARLGHCLFYDPERYLSSPLEMLKIWEGGLSSHGGAIGMLIGIWLFCLRVSKKSVIWALDRLIVGVAIGATFIRLGNLMNSEIYGAATTLPWGFSFVQDDKWGGLPCHPTQIYEALVYFSLFLLGMYMYWRTNAKEKQGLILGVMLIGIFLSRFFIEFIKNIQEPFEQTMRETIGIDMGQLLSLPFVIWGIWLVYNALKKGKTNSIKTKK